MEGERHGVFSGYNPIFVWRYWRQSRKMIRKRANIGSGHNNQFSSQQNPGKLNLHWYTWAYAINSLHLETTIWCSDRYIWKRKVQYRIHKKIHAAESRPKNLTTLNYPHVFKQLRQNSYCHRSLPCHLTFNHMKTLRIIKHFQTFPYFFPFCSNPKPRRRPSISSSAASLGTHSGNFI